MPPLVSDIPAANTLNQRLDTLNKAIASLGAGSTVINLTVSAPPQTDPMQMVMAISVSLDPPISDPATIADLTAALQAQADAITAQLVDMGYDASAAPEPGPSKAA